MTTVLIIGGAVILLIAVIVLYGRSKQKGGAAKAREKAKDEALDQANEGKKIDEKIRDLDDDDLDRLL